MFHFQNVVQFRLDYFRYVWDSEKTSDRCQHLETFRPFKVSRAFLADWLSVIKKRMDKQYSHEADITTGLKSLDS